MKYIEKGEAYLGGEGGVCHGHARNCFGVSTQEIDGGEGHWSSTIAV